MREEGKEGEGDEGGEEMQWVELKFAPFSSNTYM